MNALPAETTLWASPAKSAMFIVSCAHCPSELGRIGIRRAAIGPAMSPLQGWAVCGTVGYKQDAPDGAKNERVLAGGYGFTAEKWDFSLNYRGRHGRLDRRDIRERERFKAKDHIPDRMGKTRNPDELRPHRQRPSAGAKNGVAKSPVRGSVFREINLRRTGSSRRQILWLPRARVVAAVVWGGELSRCQPTSIHL